MYIQNQNSKVVSSLLNQRGTRFYSNTMVTDLVTCWARAQCWDPAAAGIRGRHGRSISLRKVLLTFFEVKENSSFFAPLGGPTCDVNCAKLSACQHVNSMKINSILSFSFEEMAFQKVLSIRRKRKSPSDIVVERVKVQ